MEKYSKGVKAGLLPALFLYTGKEDQEKNHELQEKPTFRSEVFHSNHMTNRLSERSLRQTNIAHDLSDEGK